MAASAQADGVRAIAGPAVAATGLVLEDVTVTSAGRRRVLRITVDLPADALGGVSLDAVATATQAVSAALDATSVMGGMPYLLEVSSPGVDRPLTERRHWSRARRRLVTVTLVDGGSAEGRLTTVDDDGLEVGGRRIPWAEVVRGRVQVDFSGVGNDPDGDLDEGTDDGTADEADEQDDGHDEADGTGEV